MTEQDYLDRKGVGSITSDYSIDKLRGLKTSNNVKKMQKETLKANNEYQKRRQQAKEEYAQLKKEGKIKEPTKIERLKQIARGNPDREDVQSARRLLEKYKRRGLI